MTKFDSSKIVFWPSTRNLFWLEPRPDSCNFGIDPEYCSLAYRILRSGIPEMVYTLEPHILFYTFRHPNENV